MSNPQGFMPGDYLVFQIESGFAMLRILAIRKKDNDMIWHIAVYRDFYIDVESADAAVISGNSLALELEHVAITNRAFESTQVSRLASVQLSDAEKAGIDDLINSGAYEISDRSIRLLLGLR